jgi:GNAT superfamily N-acetyltransferase
LLVGRLAVDQRFRRKRIGTNLCSWCLGLARELSKQVGCRYVTFHAQREDAISFYKNNFFVLSEAEERLPTKLLYRKVVEEEPPPTKLDEWAKSY